VRALPPSPGKTQVFRQKTDLPEAYAGRVHAALLDQFLTLCHRKDDTTYGIIVEENPGTGTSLELPQIWDRPDPFASDAPRSSCRKASFRGLSHFYPPMAQVMLI